VSKLPRAGAIHTLFNTHWHPEHTGSNAALGKAGATIIAQQNTQLWLSTDVTWPWNKETVQPLPKQARPNKPFFTRGELKAGRASIEYGHLRDCPHTDGDLYAYFPEQNVLAAGGALIGGAWQLPDWWTGGWIGGLVGGLEHLLKIAKPDTRIVPARGPVLTHADLKEQYEMYSVVWERLAKLLYTGRGPEEAVAAAPTKEYDAKMGNPDEFVRRSFRSMWAYLTPDA
jgi:glyoxylase-like metal-dependent hydrolase (beta-lactamase superfamily II)